MKTRLLLTLLAACSAVLGQTDSGSIRVFVVDPTASKIGEAAVRLTNIATGVSLSHTTDADGYATFSPAARGNYVIDVERPGFQKTHVTDVSLDVNENKLVRVNLQVASVTSTVEVSAAANIIQSEQGSLGQVIQGNVAVDLPLAARPSRNKQILLLRCTGG